ncbi:MAG: PqqD family protein [Anaerolineales bacterium]|nr:PqqD family protein [Anaerolineales bacterium]MCB8951619.1 PqqD family protein [Ardenticatenales bacterium]
MDPQLIPLPVPDIIWRILDGEVVLVSPRAGKVRVLNEVGSALWQLLDGKRTVGEMQAYLVRHYDVMPAQAAADLDTFLQDLAARGLIQLTSH